MELLVRPAEQLVELLGAADLVVAVVR